MNKKNILSWCIVIGLVVSMVGLTGCETLRKKFVRKKKEEKKGPPHYYQIQDYEIKPSIDLYQKHYSYWKNWHSEIVATLGENSVKDKLCITEIIGNLKDMGNLLVDEKAQSLDKHIKKLEEIQKDIVNKELTSTTITRIRNTLEREARLIKREFTYTKMGPYLRAEFKSAEEFKK